MSINPFLDYIYLEKKCSEHTLKAYRSDIEEYKLFIEKQEGESDLIGVSYGEIRIWIVDLIQKKNSTRTVNRKISVLRSYYKYLMKIGSLEVSPLKEHKALKMASKVQLPFSVEEVNSV